ncbi:alpha/beta-type small acid-soluble spore protein [Paenibacillus koleovorans]|uniref:alpha/beta-type small acid-soluble spore protein n=1 Tax=Paenibacillus koleovorans TaxID=121608 RepID=UPI000FD89408|nr:alpha/beta-type small acid-soluble spore protein [Paenibacillus koleovorans]
MARRAKLVPGCADALNQMKYEVAAELGIDFGQAAGANNSDVEFAGDLGSAASAGGMRSSYLGNLTAREAGAVGGSITQRLVRMAQQMES